MGSAFTTAEVEANIATLKTALTATSAALTAILGGAQSYTLDSGQSRQTVTRANLSELRQQRAALLEEIQMWQTMLDGDGAVRMVPGW